MRLLTVAFLLLFSAIGIGAFVQERTLAVFTNTGSVNANLFKTSRCFGGDAPVTIPSASYSPQTITVDVGCYVKWTNTSNTAHTSTSDTGVWDSGDIPKQGGTYQRQFSSTGTFPYHCNRHPAQTGTVIVVNP